MGNTDHSAKLREGPKAWNDWREANPGVTPDLRSLGLSLGEKQFSPANGGPVDLSDALLSDAQLRSAGLISVRLTNAYLRRADLTMALLVSADLSHADLREAVLDHADLGGAVLTGALLDGARLHLARHLTQAQIDAAHGDARTSLPAGLLMPPGWTADDDAHPLPADEAEDAFLAAPPHAALGLSPKPSRQEVRTAYLELAKKYHPDVNPGDPAAERRFKKIAESYRQLTAPRKPRAKPPKRRGVKRWAAAAALFVLSFGATAFGIYLYENRRLAAALQAQPPLTMATATPRDAALSAPDSAHQPAGSNPAAPEIPQTTKPAETIAAETPAEDVGGLAAAEAAEQQSERINVSAPVEAPIPQATQDLITTQSAPPAVAQPEGQMPGRLAALPSTAPGSTEAGLPPTWDAEWAGLSASEDLPSLYHFIRRYPDKPVAEEARARFRAVIAASTDLTPLRNLISQTVEDSPETTFARRHLVRLGEQQAAEADARQWSQTMAAGTIAAFRAYILHFPDGSHIDEAQERLTALEEEVTGRKMDSADWAEARRSGTRAAYQAYLKSHPSGVNAARAKARLAALTAQDNARRKEDSAWAQARKGNGKRDYYGYLKAYPNGRYASQAQNIVEDAERASTQRQRQQQRAVRATAETQRPKQNPEPHFPSSDAPFFEPF